MKNSIPVNRFIQSRPRISLLLALTFCTVIALAVTQVQASLQDQSEIAQKNPHHLPDNLNPKLHRLTDNLGTFKLGLKEELKEDLNQAKETIHSLAFKNNVSTAKPTYDYTTGTSN